MPLTSGKGYRTFAITGQKVTLSSGSVPNLSGIFYGDNSTSRTMVQQRNKANQDSFYQTPDDIRTAVQKYMSASASDITRLNDVQITNLSFQHQSQRNKSYTNGGFSSRGSSRANSPAPSRHLEVSIRVSTPDESNGKMPPTGRGRPHSPNISMVRGPKFSVFYFNDDFTFDEDTSQAQLAENMFNDLTISSSLGETSTTLFSDADDKTPMNSSNSDGGYVSSELSDNTINDSPKIDVKRIQEAQRVFSDPNNNNAFKRDENQRNENEERRAQMETTADSFGVDLYLTASDLDSKPQQESENNTAQYDKQRQRTVSKMSDDVFSETSADETMRFSELKLSEASSMASTLHNDDLESNLSYDIRINDTMGIPMVSTLKRQDAPSKEINLTVFNDNTITQEDGLLPVKGDHQVLHPPSPNKPDIPENKNWKQERSSSFSGFTHLQRLKETSSRSYRTMNRVKGEHNYVKRNDSFVKSIENVSPWKGSWTARNVTFDETANQKFQIESRQERREQLENHSHQNLGQSNAHHYAQQDIKQSRPPPPPNYYGSLDVRRHNRNQQESYQQQPQPQMRRAMPQQSNLARHMHNTSAPTGNVSNQAWKRYSSPPSLEPHFSAYNNNGAQEERVAIKVSQPGNPGSSNHGPAPRGPTARPGQGNQNAVNNPRSDIQNMRNYSTAVPKDYKYPTLPRNYGGQNVKHQNQTQRNAPQQQRDFAKERKAQLKEFISEIPPHNLQNQNQRIVRQYYNQFFDQNYNKAPKPQPRTQPHSMGHSQQYPNQTQQVPQPTRHNQNVQIGQNQLQRYHSNPSLRSSSFSSYSNSTSSSPVRSPSQSYTTTLVSVPDTSSYNKNTSSKHNKSARRKLQLSDSDGENDDGGFRRHQTKVAEQKEEEIEENAVTRHPGIHSIQEPHRWVGSGYQVEPVRLSADRGFLLWHHPKGTLDVMIYYGLTGEEFSCFIEHQLPGVDVFYVHPTGRKELLLDGTRSDHDSPDSKRSSKSHWSHNFNRNKEIRSWGGQIVLRLEPLKYFPCQSFKLPYFLAL